ncbi:unnamed protein product, partial [Enterobius vermicularis]|uniref:Trehalase n=1 Tax=Enterobius vermicularis TaxID=51028 RepID=A0A158QAI1_ENTVE
MTYSHLRNDLSVELKVVALLFFGAQCISDDHCAFLLFVLTLVNHRSVGDHAGIQFNKRTPDTYQRISVVYEPDLPNCTEPVCTGPLAEIYCFGKLIYTSWLFGLYGKCPGEMMRNPPDRVLNAFKKLKYPLKKDEFKTFCYENFVSSPYGIFLCSELNEIWKSLGREFIPQVKHFPDRFPVLAVPNSFVVPGGQFQIYFYWDSYWIIKGGGFLILLFLKLTRRTQPPLFTQMVADYYSATNNATFLSRMIPYIDKELAWWRTNRSVIAITNCPRPENYLVDLDNGYHGDDKSTNIWSSIASACESGLDFSSRWFGYSGTQAGTKFSIRTNKIVPVDLNVLMVLNYWEFANMLNKLKEE